MKYIKDQEIYRPERTVVALGKFDGVHAGHAKLLKAAVEAAREKELETVAFTFDVSPQLFINGGKRELLTTNDERRELIEKIGIDAVVEYSFEKIMNIPPGDFIKDILIGELRANAVAAGNDLKFGREASGDVELLEKAGRECGFEVIIVPKEMDGDVPISSSYIKGFLKKGDMEKTTELLGYPYFIEGTVVVGRRLGRTLGFPTVNLIPAPEKLLPPNGVYASVVQIGEEEYRSITNIGTKPTVDGSFVGAETHILDFSRDMYGKKIKVSLMHFMRPEVRFGSLEELKKQVDSDMEKRRKM